MPGSSIRVQLLLCPATPDHVQFVEPVSTASGVPWSSTCTTNLLWPMCPEPLKSRCCSVNVAPGWSASATSSVRASALRVS